METEKLDNEQKEMLIAMQKFIVFLINHSIKLYNDEMTEATLKHSFVNEIDMNKFNRLKIGLLAHQFLMIIDKSYARNKGYGISKCIVNIIRIEDMINHLIDNVKNNDLITKVFTDFETLSDYLLMSDLSQSEMLVVLTNVVFVNLFLPAFKLIENENQYNIIYNSTKKNLEKNLVKAQKRKNIVKTINITKQLQELDKVKNVYNNCKTIEHHYFEKRDCYDVQDVDVLMKAFADLKVNNEVLKKIRRVLVKPLKSPKSSAEIKNISFSKPKQDNCLISDAEYKKLRKELNTYFNNEDFLKILTEDKINRCLEILVQLGETEQIHGFLDSIEKTIENKNPISYYVSIYQKLKYYEKKIDIKLPLKNIEDYLQKIFICSDSDYEFWKELIEEELNKIIKLIPTNHEYEIEEAKKRIFKQK